MHPVTDRQRQVLALIAEGMRIRQIRDALGIVSTHAAWELIEKLATKGMLVATRAPGATGRYTVTAAGWAELGRKICPTCEGHGTIPNDTRPRR